MAWRLTNGLAIAVAILLWPEEEDVEVVSSCKGRILAQAKTWDSGCKLNKLPVHQNNVHGNAHLGSLPLSAGLVAGEFHQEQTQQPLTH